MCTPDMHVHHSLMFTHSLGVFWLPEFAHLGSCIFYFVNQVFGEDLTYYEESKVFLYLFNVLFLTPFISRCFLILYSLDSILFYLIIHKIMLSLCRNLYIYYSDINYYSWFIACSSHFRLGVYIRCRLWLHLCYSAFWEARRNRRAQHVQGRNNLGGWSGGRPHEVGGRLTRTLDLTETIIFLS